MIRYYQGHPEMKNRHSPLSEWKILSDHPAYDKTASVLRAGNITWYCEYTDKTAGNHTILFLNPTFWNTAGSLTAYQTDILRSLIGLAADDPREYFAVHSPIHQNRVKGGRGTLEQTDGVLPFLSWNRCPGRRTIRFMRSVFSSRGHKSVRGSGKISRTECKRAPSPNGRVRSFDPIGKCRKNHRLDENLSGRQPPAGII